MVEDRGFIIFFINLLIKFFVEVNVIYWNLISDVGVFMKWNLNIYLNIFLGKEKCVCLCYFNMFFFIFYMYSCVFYYLFKIIMYIFY